MNNLCKIGSVYVITDAKLMQKRKNIKKIPQQSKKPWVSNFISKARNISAVFFLYTGAYSNQSSIYLKHVLK